MKRYITIQYGQDDSVGFTKRLELLTKEGWNIVNCGFENKGYSATKTWWAILSIE